jgi:type I restriction enzyme S subunit
MSFRLSPDVDGDKVFLVKWSELEGRLDPSSYSMKNIFLVSSFPLRKLTTYFFINPSIKDSILENEIYSFLPMENISDKNANVKKMGTIQGHDSKGYTPFMEGDFLFSKITPCMENGKMAIAENMPYKIGFGSTEFHVFREKSNQVSVRFLHSLFLIDNFRKYAKCNFTGTTGHQRVPPEFFYKLLIPIPPKEIQAKIVEEMDTAYATKKQKEAKAQRLLDSIDDYLLGELGIELPEQEENTIQRRIFIRQLSEVSGGRFDPFYYQQHYRVIQNVLSCSKNIKRLSELLQILESGSRPKGGVSNIQSGVLSFGGEHVNNQCEIEVNKPKYIPQEFHNTHKLTETQINDLLLVKDGATTGKIGIVNNDEHVGKNINEHIFLIRAKETVNPNYLLYFLKSPIGNLQIKREITGGTVTGITRNVVKRLQVIIPNLKKQTEIANHIKNIRNQAKQLQQQAKAELEQAKKEMETMILGEDESKA